MRGHSSWNYRPYSRLSQLEKRTRPFLCRLVPTRDAIELEWFDAGGTGLHWVQYRLRGNKDWAKLPLTASTAPITGLKPGHDYDERTDNRRRGTPIKTLALTAQPPDG